MLRPDYKGDNMRKIDSINMIQTELPKGEFKAYLIRKYKGILQDYDLNDISGMFSIVLLEKEDIGYISDKFLEFCEEVTFDDTAWLHTVWAASDGYSEDIYIPYCDDIKAVVEGRCI